MYTYHIPKEGLTKENYYSDENTAISNSKVKDFLKSKELFFNRHLAHSQQPDKSPSMLVGSLLDDIVNRGSMRYFLKHYQVKVLKKDNPELYEKQQHMALRDPDRILTDDIYAKVVKMGDKMIKAPFYKWYKKNKTVFQVPMWNSFENWALSKDADYEFTPGGIIPIAHVCGMIDALTIDVKHSTIYVDDVKSTTTSKIRSPQAWYWHCLDMGYIRQLALYQWLVKQAYPEFDKIICRHVCISNERADMHPIRLFTIPQSLLDVALKEFFSTVILITQEEKFIDDLPSWDDALALPEAVPQSVMMDDDGESMEVL